VNEHTIKQLINLHCHQINLLEKEIEKIQKELSELEEKYNKEFDEIKKLEDRELMEQMATDEDKTAESGFVRKTTRTKTGGC
jgi:cell division protein FtsB